MSLKECGMHNDAPTAALVQTGTSVTIMRSLRSTCLKPRMGDFVKAVADRDRAAPAPDIEGSRKDCRTDS